MASYVVLMKLTDQGITAIKDAPERIDDGIKAWEGMGGQLTGFYSTLGEYDYVAVGEAPSDEVAAAFSMALGSRGFVRTTTLRAWPREAFAEIVKRLP